MKKVFGFLICAVLMLTVIQTAFAAQDNLRVHNATAKKGETVYLAVELQESVVGNAVAVSYTYNSKHLKPVTTSCSWARSGLIRDFDRKGGKGVWAAAQSEDLKGGVCVLAFEVRMLAKFTETDVSCTVIVKNDSQDMGTYTATGKVILACDHTYGDWADCGVLGHRRICSLCDGQQTSSHEWDKGTVITAPDDPMQQSKVFTCQVCDATKSEQVNRDEQILPTLPQQPTEPPQSTKPEQGAKPTQPKPNQPTNPPVTEPTGPITAYDPNKQETTPGQTQRPDSGNQDNQGTQGSQGGQGNQGTQGNQGNQGNQGTQGNPGIQDNPQNLPQQKPTQPVYNPNAELPTKETYGPDGVMQKPADSQDGYPDNSPDHSQDENANVSVDGTIPQDILEEILQNNEDDHAGHDHASDGVSGGDGGPAVTIAVVAALAVLIGGMVFFVKRKR